MIRNRRFLPAVALCLCSLAAGATGVGDTLSALELKDAHGKPQQLADHHCRIYASIDRKGDKLIKAALAERKQAALDAQHAVVIADISGAPGFVKRIIRSSLKDRDYSTWLDEKGSTERKLARRDKRISVIDIDRRKVTALQFLGDEEALGAALDETLACAAAAPPAAESDPAPSPAE